MAAFMRDFPDSCPPQCSRCLPVGSYRIINPIRRVINAQMALTIQCTQYLTVNYDIIYQQEEDGNNNDRNKPQGTTPVS